MLYRQYSKCLALGALALGFFSTAFASDITPLRTGPVSQYGQLMAGKNAQNEGRIYGSCAAYSTSGNEVQVKGMSLFWSNEQTQNRYWKDDVITGLVQKQGVQLIRAAMAVDEQGWGNGHYFINGKTEYYQDLLDEVVESAIKNDIYVIIDFHSHTANKYTDRAKEFFKIQAKKWGRYDNVIFEIFNEPLCVNGEGDKSGNNCREYGGMLGMAGIKAYADEVIPIIRRYSDNLIVVGTPRWSSAVADAVGYPANDPLGNTAYTLHYYGGYTESGETHLFSSTSPDLAMQNGLSIFVTEWGAIGYDGGGTVSWNGSDQNNIDWLNWMDNKKLSSANWNAGYNGSDGGETASEYFRVKFDGVDASTVEWTDDTYSTSAKWVNQHVFAGLANETYTQCQNYVSLDPVPADDPDFDDSGDDFGDVYEDEVIPHDFVVVDFDMNNLGGGNYSYVYSSLDDPNGSWTWYIGNDGEKTFFVDGSNAGGLVKVFANDGDGWAGFGIYLKEIKGCEVLSFRYKGLANDFSFNAGGSALIQESLIGTESWMTQSISLDGIDPVVLESPLELKWQVSGSPSGEDLYIDDVVCGEPASGSNDSPVPPYMIDDFETVDDGYAWPYAFMNGTTTIGNESNEYGYIVRFSEAAAPGSDYGIGLVGINTTGTDWADAVLVKEVAGISSGCSVISYQYKGVAHVFKAVDPDLDVNANSYDVHRMYVGGSDSWKTVWIDISELKQLDHNEVLDLSKVTSLRWEVNNYSGNLTDAYLFVDNVECVKAPEQRICDAEYCEYNITSQFDFAYAGDGWTIANESDGNGNIYGHFYDANDDKTYFGMLNAVAPAGGGWAGAGINVENLNQCRILSYKYKGFEHDLTFQNEPANGDPSYGMLASASDSWREVAFDLSNLKGTDLGASLNVRWQKHSAGDGSLYIDDVKCVLPASSSSSTSSSSSSSDVVEAYLVEDFSRVGGTAEYKYVFADTWTIANSKSYPDWSLNPDDMEYDVTTRDSEQGIVGAVLQVSRVGEEEGGAGIGVHVSNLSGCATLQYKYKGLEHNLAFFNNQDNVMYAERFNRADNGWMTVTYDMNRAVAEGLDIDAALDIQWHVLEPDGETDLLVDDVKCLQPANSSSSSGDEPASSSSNVLPDAAAPTTYAALFDDFEDGDYYPLWDGIGQWWVETDQGGNGGATTATLDFVEGSSSQYALQMEYTYDVGDYQWGPPYAAISTNDFMEMNLSQCRAVQYDYKGAAHKFRVKVSAKMNDLLDMGWGFPTFAVTSPSESWRTITVPIASMQQEWTGSNEIYTPVETVIQYANGFDWRVDGDSVNDKSSGSLAIDNIRCVGLDHYAAISVEVVDGKLAATIDGAFTDPEGVNIPSPIVVDTVVFDRTFSASGYSTIMLPFSINRNAIEGVSKVLTFSGIGRDISGKKQVEMTEIGENGELNAYTPYMVELESEGGLVFHGGTVIQPTEGANTAARSDDGWEFRGTLSKIVWDESHPDLGRVYGFSGKETDKIRIGQFVKAAAGAWISPFRAYMIYAPEGKSVGKSTGYTYVAYEPIPDYMDVVIVGRDALGEEYKKVIGGLNTRTGEFMMMQDYDLKGRKLNGKPASRGVYYGKKKIIK